MFSNSNWSPIDALHELRCPQISRTRCHGYCQKKRTTCSAVPIFTLVTLGRLTDVSLNKNGGSREAVKNKGSVWVEGERIRSPFLTRRKITLNREETLSEAYWNITWGLLSLRRRHLVIFTAGKLENLVHYSSERNNVLYNSNVFQFWLFSSLISALMLFILHGE